MCSLRVLLLSNVTPKLRAKFFGVIDVFPIFIDMRGSFEHCVRKPINNSSVLLSLTEVDDLRKNV